MNTNKKIADASTSTIQISYVNSLNIQTTTLNNDTNEGLYHAIAT